MPAPIKLDTDRATYGNRYTAPGRSIGFGLCCQAVVELFNSDYACVPCARRRGLLPFEDAVLRRQDILDAPVFIGNRSGIAYVDVLLLITGLCFAYVAVSTYFFFLHS